MDNFEKVREFMETFGQEVLTIPQLPDKKVRELRKYLIAEELDELAVAIEDEDLTEIADALTDLLYVVYGAGHAFGIDLNKCFDEVHRSNMSKLEDGKVILRDDGNDFYRYFRYTCEKCGNKRCPHHLNHIFKCTGSNELNQEGVIDVDN
jgi:predicted HAD superfamily Cof-like phosphohydrolase